MCKENHENFREPTHLGYMELKLRTFAPSYPYFWTAG